MHWRTTYFHKFKHCTNFGYVSIVYIFLEYRYIGYDIHLIHKITIYVQHPVYTMWIILAHIYCISVYTQSMWGEIRLNFKNKSAIITRYLYFVMFPKYWTWSQIVFSYAWLQFGLGWYNDWFVEIGNVLSWWRHQMETFSALLDLCARNSPVTGEFHAQRPVTQSFDVFFDLCPNKRLSKQSWGWWLDRAPNDVTVMYFYL